MALLALSVSSAGVAVIAIRNYRAARNLLSADPPSPLLAAPQRTGIAGLEAVTFTAADGAHIAGWYVPSRNRGAVIVTHGTNSDRTTMLPEISLLAAAGFGVLAFDWPGLGQSSGVIRWDTGARNALTAALDWLTTTRRADVDPGRIGGLGFSIGAFVMTQVAADDPRLAAVVLEGTPPDMDAYRRHNNGRWGPIGIIAARRALSDSGLLAPEWSPIRLVGRIAPRPVFVLGGAQDREIPSFMADAFYAAARQPKEYWSVPGADHGNYIAAAPDEYPRRLVAFFNRVLPASGERITP